MEYYILQEAAGTQETGNTYPQVVCRNLKKTNPNPFLIANTVKLGEHIPENILPFEPLELDKGARLTDIMSSPFRMNGFLISHRLKKLFQHIGVVESHYYPVKIIYNNGNDGIEYYYFHSTSCLRDYIDYNKSKFFINKRGRGFSHYVTNIETYSDLDLIRSTLDLDTSIKPEQFYLKASFPYSQPLFRICAFNYDFFITSKLKFEIDNNKITGAHILPAKELIKTPNLS